MKRSKKSEKMIRELRGQLLEWYDRHRRSLPWRAVIGQKPDPYHIWLSEVMLQQTTVQAVKDYYIKFLEKWPAIHDLAAADEAEVMAAWAGLGYYARARNLQKCAKLVSEELGGEFPQTQDALKKLPGIGDYTSAAISAIAFNMPATVMDGNIERVMARLFNIREPLPKSKSLLKARAAEFFENFHERPGDLAQGFMDLGAGICIPKVPRCSLCPLNQGCAAYKAGDPKNLPVKAPKKKRPQRFGYVYWIENGEGGVLFEKRAAKGLLGGMTGLPTSEWLEDEHALSHMEGIDSVQSFGNETVRHTFTHFDLELKLFKADKEKGKRFGNSYYCADAMTEQAALPTVFAKALRLFYS